MKLEKIIYTLAAVLALGLAGCSKQDSGTPTAADAQKATGPAGDAFLKAADTAQTGAAKLDDSTKATAEKAAAEVSSKAQELIDKAKSLVAGSKYQEALTTLQQLSTPNSHPSSRSSWMTSRRKSRR